MRILPLLLTLFQGPSQDYPVFETDLVPPAITRQRGDRLKTELPPNTVTLILTNPWRNRSNDTDFRFRPDSDFRYLTGFEEPDSALLLAPSGIEWQGKKVTELLFVNVSDKSSETWLGYRMGPQNAEKLLGIAAAPNGDLKTVLSKIAPTNWILSAPPDPNGTVADMIKSFDAWHQGIPRDKFSVPRALGKMRVKKEPIELDYLRKAIDASVVGHREAMRTAEPNMWEYEIQAVVEYAFTKLGCEFQGYNSIVGSGPSSCILHYEADRRQMKAGEIICMDVGGEYHGYSADVTRSFPVNGKFTPAQKAIYELVLASQEAGIAACRSGASFQAPHEAATKVLAEGMIRLGIIKSRSELGQYFMHGTSHYIGLDVHDPMGDFTLRPNYVLTVEPGIYIKAGSPCDPKWWNIGVRIEDDILVTEGEPVNLSAGAPRKVAEIEALMRQKGVGNAPLDRPKGKKG